MPKINITVNDYGLANFYGGQVYVGNAFAFIAPESKDDDTARIQKGLSNFYGAVAPIRRTIPYLPGGVELPGFNLNGDKIPLKVAPVLLPDKEIYRAGQDKVRLLVVTPKWSEVAKLGDNVVNLAVELNGSVFRTLPIKPGQNQLTLLELDKLPDGNYRVYFDNEAATDYEGKKAECKFSVVEYVLAPLQATLLAHQLQEKKLACRLKVEQLNEPVNASVHIELWSGAHKLGNEKVKPEAPGIFSVEFKLKNKSDERLELRVAYQDLIATAVIPGSRKAERDDTLISNLGSTVNASMLPRPGSREVRGIYLQQEMDFTNSPVTLENPAPESRKTKVRWNLATEAARLLVVDVAGQPVTNLDLGNIPAGHEVTIEIPAPVGFLAVGGWVNGLAWEGFASLLTPTAQALQIIAPSTQRPGQTVEIGLETGGAASVYMLVRDARLSGSTPKERLAAALKSGFKGASEWGTTANIILKANELPGFYPPPPPSMPYPTTRSAPVPRTGILYSMREAIAPSSPPQMMAGGAPGGAWRDESRGASLSDGILLGLSSDDMEFDMIAEGAKSGAPRDQKQKKDATGTEPRSDFADIAFCEIVQIGASGQAKVSFKLPDAITSYNVEAFALSENGAEWNSSHETIEVTQPLWSEFKLPVFVYPGDQSPATLHLGSSSGKFGLKLTCNGKEVAFQVSGATQTTPGVFNGNRAKITFVATPGKWRAELEDLQTQERDAVEREVQELGKFKSLARRFKLALAGETLSLEKLGAVQFRVLPSLEKSFNLVCDSTTNYSHKCCEQTAAKLLSAVAGLVAGGDKVSLRDAILTGIAREKKMYVAGKGFTMYPPEESGSHDINDYWGKLAAEHLRDLALVGEALFAPGAAPLEADLANALHEAMAMGKDTAKAYKLPDKLEQVASGHDSYKALASGVLRSEALNYARKQVKEKTSSNDAVMLRQELAYCTATLLRGGEQNDIAAAVQVANQLAESLGSEGRLYSTVDSVAFIAMLSELKAAGIGAGGKGKLRLDGQEMSTQEAIAASAAGTVREIAILEGAALVETSSEILEDWNAFRAEIPVAVKLDKKSLRGLRSGDNVELVVKLNKYEPGLLVHVCLPSALSKIEGGGEVKKFSVDFAGRTEVRIPLRATGYTLEGGEHWALLVRNMFKEEQAGNPGVLSVNVAAD